MVDTYLTYKSTLNAMIWSVYKDGRYGLVLDRFGLWMPTLFFSYILLFKLVANATTNFQTKS